MREEEHSQTWERSKKRKRKLHFKPQSLGGVIN